jgi:hypothetical protein
MQHGRRPAASAARLGSRGDLLVDGLKLTLISLVYYLPILLCSECVPLMIGQLLRVARHCGAANL